MFYIFVFTDDVLQFPLTLVCKKLCGPRRFPFQVTPISVHTDRQTAALCSQSSQSYNTARSLWRGSSELTQQQQAEEEEATGGGV